MIRVLQLDELLRIQVRLNDLTKPDWKENLNTNDFYVAIMDELGEFMGSGRNWKWWKKGPGKPDMWNEKLEIVDIIHFYLSILFYYSPKTNRDRTFGYRAGTADCRAEFVDDSGAINRDNLAITVRRMFGMIHSDVIDEMVKGVGMTDEEFSATYMAKATLNEIRQSKGYKEGSYEKVQDGVEDNDRLSYIVGAFLEDDNMTLNDVKTSVFNEFFQKV